MNLNIAKIINYLGLVLGLSLIIPRHDSEAGVQFNAAPIDQFCQRLHAAVYASTSLELIAARRGEYASQVTRAIGSQLRLGQLARYQKVELPGVLIPVDAMQYISTVHVLGAALGSSRPALLSLSADDLRYLPYVQRGSEIVLVASSAMPLNSQRARAVASVAQRQDIRISVLWTGDVSGKLQHDAKALEFLSIITGGRFIPLGSDKTACQRSA